jgi:hypothetical protein
VSLAIGILIGVSLPVLVFGVGATHTICREGPILGTSGPLVAPFEVSVAPPGGLVDTTFALNTSFGGTPYSSFGGGLIQPENGTSAALWAYNWTLRGENSTTVAGWGPAVACTGRDLLASGSLANGSSGCGCSIAPPVSAGVGQRVELPARLSYNGVPAVLLNETYGPTPIASFNWSENDSGVRWSNPGNFAGLPVTVGPFYEFNRLVGIGIFLHLSKISFGVPINITGGGVENLPASFPSAFGLSSGEEITMSIATAYILPADTDQGSWSVYLPGGGGPFSPGGLLFEQTAELSS